VLILGTQTPYDRLEMKRYGAPYRLAESKDLPGNPTVVCAEQFRPFFWSANKLTCAAAGLLD